MELTDEKLTAHTILTDIIDPQKDAFILEYIRQQSQLIPPQNPNPEKRKPKRKSNVVASMRKRDDPSSKSPLSPSNQQKKKSKPTKRLTIKNKRGIFNKGVRSNVARK
jgi:hypothetical protein